MRSFLPDYELVVPADLPAALDLLHEGESWRPLAGGTDLMVLFNAGKLPFRRLISIRALNELAGIHVLENAVNLGASVTFTQIRENDTLKEEFPLLCKAASWTGGIANQNRGTLGGNIVNASPAADSPPALLVYDATLRLVSARGERWVPYASFHSGYKQMDLRTDELLAEITLPRGVNFSRQYSRKVGARRAQAISKVSFAAAAKVTDGLVEDIRLALGSVAPVPIRCLKTESLLRGASVNTSLLSNARECLLEEISPISDIRSTDEYRATVSANLLEEFLRSLA